MDIGYSYKASCARPG